MKTTASSNIGSSAWARAWARKLMPCASLLLGLCTLGGTQHAQTQTTPSTAPPEVEAKMTSEVAAEAFQSFDSDSQFTIEMQERLRDPQQRAAMRAEHRTYIAAFHPDVARVLNIDVATREKLFDLLADQEMEQLDTQSSSDEPPVPMGDLMASMRADAERANKRLEPLRKLLGKHRLARYQRFKETSGERLQVDDLDKRLGAAHKLSADRRDRLVTLLHEQNVATRELRLLDDSLQLPLNNIPVDDPAALAQMQRRSQLQHLATQEEGWRRMPESDRLLRERAAAFLTPPQLAMLAQMQAEKAQMSRRSIERSRVDAGLSPDIPEQSEGSRSLPAPVAGEVKISLRLTVNRSQPVDFTHVVNSGETVTFAAPEGLLVEAMPMLFDGQWCLRMSYYERDSAGKRLIGSLQHIGSTEASAAAPNPDQMSFSGTVMVGTKAYAIGTNAQVERI
jgi:hypothetical protein